MSFPRFPDPARRAKLLQAHQLRQQGLTMRQIAHEMDCAVSTVSGYLRDYELFRSDLIHELAADQIVSHLIQLAQPDDPQHEQRLADLRELRLLLTSLPRSGATKPNAPANSPRAVSPSTTTAAATPNPTACSRPPPKKCRRSANRPPTSIPSSIRTNRSRSAPNPSEQHRTRPNRIPTATPPLSSPRSPLPPLGGGRGRRQRGVPPTEQHRTRPNRNPPQPQSRMANPPMPTR